MLVWSKKLVRESLHTQRSCRESEQPARTDSLFFNTLKTPTRPTWSVIFWPSSRPKNTIPRLYTGRKWHIPTASNRKRSRGRIKAYDMGRGEGPIVPLNWLNWKETRRGFNQVRHVPQGLANQWHGNRNLTKKKKMGNTLLISIFVDYFRWFTACVPDCDTFGCIVILWFGPGFLWIFVECFGPWRYCVLVYEILRLLKEGTCYVKNWSVVMRNPGEMYSWNEQGH